MKKETLVSIAERSGCSISTVSRVLSGNAAKYRISQRTVARVTEEVKRCNYTPSLLAKGLRTNRTDTIGLLIPNIENSFFAGVAGVVIRESRNYNYKVVLGVIVNYVGAPKGDPVVLFLGVALIVVAIICNGIASGRMRKSGDSAAQNRKGIILAVVAGVLMSFFYRFVAAAMDLDNFAAPTPGMLTPYSAIFVFSVGVLLSNFAFNTYAMRRPFVGAPVSYREYFRGSLPTHLVGMLGGAVWCLGTAFSYIAAGKAGAAISYALGQGAPMIAAVWGVFIWKEFKGADRKTNTLLAVMFLFFIAGLASIIASGGN